MEIKTARDLLKGEWGGEKEKIVPFFFSHSNSLSRANEASALSNCRKEKTSVDRPCSTILICKVSLRRKYRR